MKNRSTKNTPGPKKPKGPGPFKPAIRLPRQMPPTASVGFDAAVHPAAPTRKPLEPVTTLAPVLAATEKFAESSQGGMLQQIGREADEALAIGKRVLTMLNVESKALTYNSGPTALDWAGLVYSPLTGVVQGDTDLQRNGDSLKLKGWDGTWQFTRGGVDCICAYALVQEGPNFLVLSPSSIFESTGTIMAPLSQPVWDSRLGFKMLAHGVFALTNSDPYKLLKFDHKFNHDVQYYNNSTTIYQGRVTLWLISNITGGTAPTTSFATTLSWVDN